MLTSSFPERRFRSVSLCLALGFLGVLAVTSRAEEPGFPGIERLMGAEEFRASGLQKLTPEERKVLDDWLLRYTAGEAEVLQQTNEVVREVQAKEDFEIVSRIVGDFTGWAGKTVFRLENGQVWEQRLNGRYRYKGPPNPEVKIDRNLFGYYRLTVLDTGRRVGVSQRSTSGS